jgi:hypothetical protein
MFTKQAVVLWVIVLVFFGLLFVHDTSGEHDALEDCEDGWPCVDCTAPACGGGECSANKECQEVNLVCKCKRPIPVFD